MLEDLLVVIKVVGVRSEEEDVPIGSAEESK